MKLNIKEKEQILCEIEKALQTLIRGCEALDMVVAFEIFLDSPDFIMTGTDGSQCDYSTYLGNNIRYLKTCSSFELMTYNKEIRVIDRDTAVLSWAYGAKATLKSGEVDLVEKAGATFVFRQVKNTWKVVAYHESSEPPVRVSRKQ